MVFPDVDVTLLPTLLVRIRARFFIDVASEKRGANDPIIRWRGRKWRLRIDLSGSIVAPQTAGVRRYLAVGACIGEGPNTTRPRRCSVLAGTAVEGHEEPMPASPEEHL